LSLYRGKRAGKTESSLPQRGGSDAGAHAAEDDHYVHFTLKKNNEKYWILAHKSGAAKLKAGESLPLMDIVESFDIFHGKQGQPNRASKAQLRYVCSLQKFGVGSERVTSEAF
jgi:Shwachman-Bodian-Diamond syndrome (SBDS) protein